MSLQTVSYLSDMCDVVEQLLVVFPRSYDCSCLGMLNFANLDYHKICSL